MDQEKLARLPKWAQGEIENNQRTIRDLKAHIAELNGTHPDSNVQLGNYIHGDYGLPKDSDIGFYLGEPPYRRYRNMIEVHHLRTKDRQAVRVSVSGGLLIINPVASNAIEISIRER